MESFYPNNRSTILERIARLDKSAIAECVDLYGAMIWTLAKQNTDSSADAERAAAEIFADIWEKAVLCDSKVSQEAVWITLIAKRRLSQYTTKSDLPTAIESKIRPGGQENVQRKMATV